MVRCDTGRTMLGRVASFVTVGSFILSGFTTLSVNNQYRSILCFSKAEEGPNAGLSFVNPAVPASKGSSVSSRSSDPESRSRNPTPVSLDSPAQAVRQFALQDVDTDTGPDSVLVDADGEDQYLQVLGENLAILSMEELEAAKMLIDMDQQHLISSWPVAGEADADKKRLLAQISSLNEKYPGGLPAYISKARELLLASAAGENPFEGYSPSVPEGETLIHGTESFLDAEDRGVQAACKAGFVLVAGGLGERLGYSGIKLSLPVEITSDRTYLEVYADYILALQHRCQAVSNDPSITLPLVIMTSDDTDAPTRQLIAEGKNFGMAEGQIKIIKQDKVPALGDSAAHLVPSKDDPYSVETKPHGHGDVHHLLLREGIAKQWNDMGMEWVFFLQDTNALVINSILPALGVSAARGFHMNSICIPRKAKEEAGAITKLNHVDGSELIINVEYNQLDPLLRATISQEGDINDPETGFSPFPGNANNLVFHLPTYFKVLSGEDQGVVTEFVNPKYKDSTRTEFKKPTRLECMMQDFPKLMAKELGNDAKIGFTTLDKWLSFSPAKNSVETGAGNAKKGTPPATISTAEAEHYAASARKLAEAAGATVGETIPVEFSGVVFNLGPRVVLMPSFAVTSRQIAEKISSDVKISSSSSLILDGQGIKINSLDLDGALVVRVSEGVNLTINDLTVKNKGWDFVPLTEEEQKLEYNAIRGYTLGVQETREIIITEPGNYIVGKDGVIVKEVEVSA